MDPSEIDRLARAWIDIAEQLIKHQNEPDYFKQIPPHPIDEMIYRAPETAWLIIDSARHMTNDEIVLATLAAGPLEYLLAKHGEKFIDRFEELAKTDKEFSDLMAGVLTRKNMSPNLVARIKAISKAT